MTVRSLLCAIGALAFTASWNLSAAEARAAICEFYNHGEYKKELSGPCQFTDGADEITIGLNNGKKYRFIPEQKRKGHYIDQDGNRLDVKHNNDYKRTYRWKNQRLIVQVAER